VSTGCGSALTGVKKIPDMNASTMYGRFSTAPALRSEWARLLHAMPTNEHAVTPRTKTQPKTSHRDGAVGSDTSNSSTPMARRTSTSAAVTTSTMSTLPRKYAAGGIGTPRRRFSVPSSRSAAMPVPRLTKVVDAIPAAIMLGARYCELVTAVPS
jgi:hypothetical protein